MNGLRLCVLALPAALAACASLDDRGTLAELRNMRVEIREEEIEGGLEKAMESYRRFLEERPDSALAPEAIRRLADLKVEREYGHLTGEGSAGRPPAAPTAGRDGSDADFERRATGPEAALAGGGHPEGEGDLERAGSREAIELYRKLLGEHPHYARNDQVLYQMSRAYEELGEVEEAMAVMDRLVRDFPGSRFLDEVQFRRAEYFFTRRRYLDAEQAYRSIVAVGAGSAFYELALYKLGWTFYKQDLDEEALDQFIALLDHKVSTGYDFAQTADEQERKRIDDTFRVISLGFSHLGGAEAVSGYFARHGGRGYEDGVYSNLGEYYVDKRRYHDAAATYNAFIRGNPFHRESPRFQMRVIEIYQAGAFPSLVLDAKKAFAGSYGLQGAYWRHFDPAAFPEVLGYLRTNLTDLANHYHALYQDPQQAEQRGANYQQALHWYREFLASFPAAGESPAVNHQLADLLLENRSFAEAATEYERTAYDYPRHGKSATAGYAAVYARREELGASAPAGQEAVRREVVRSSLQFAESFPEHEKAAIVLGAAVEDLYGLKEYEQALGVAQKLLKTFPGADAEVLRAAWLVAGHAAYELLRYPEAEAAYVQVLALLPADDKGRDALVDNLAASIYKQGEQANALGDHRGAADHFLRVGRMAPTSKIRPTAEYDAAAALMQLRDWTAAAAVLTAFRAAFPGHELQPEVTKKLAWVYREDGRLSAAAEEYERIERESGDEALRREALLIAAELHREAGSSARTLEVYRRYVAAFPQPVEPNLETRTKIAEILKDGGDRQGYLAELREIVAIDAAAGRSRTPRTRHLAATAALVLAEPGYDRFAAVTLAQPFEANLRRKKELMKAATQEFTRLLDYEVGEVTAAATFYLAEIYAHFSKALMQSERPAGLSPLEREEYELAIEEQAYPFEEKAIAVHESNLKLISQGVYNGWVDRSLQMLAEVVPARYARPEETGGVIASLDAFVFEIVRPAPLTPPPATEQAPVPAISPEAAPAAVAEPEPVQPPVTSVPATPAK